jgi:hypothetical protein
VNPLALGGGALVAPEEGLADDVAVFVEEDGAVLLAGEAEAADVVGAGAGGGEDVADGGDGGAPPIGGVLLCPAGAGCVEGVFVGGAGDDAAGFIYKDGLGSGGSDVNADGVGGPGGFLG